MIVQFDRPLPHDFCVEKGIVGVETKGQFHMIYGAEGTQALFTGLATQIVYGGCDHNTADFYSKASGTTTDDSNPDPQKANFRQRPLLTIDEVVTPQIGNCTIFARYVEPGFATQVILTARLRACTNARIGKPVLPPGRMRNHCCLNAV